MQPATRVLLFSAVAHPLLGFVGFFCLLRYTLYTWVHELAMTVIGSRQSSLLLLFCRLLGWACCMFSPSVLSWKLLLAVLSCCYLTARVGFGFVPRFVLAARDEERVTSMCFVWLSTYANGHLRGYLLYRFCITRVNDSLLEAAISRIHCMDNLSKHRLSLEST